ncbi:hypothetical protein EV06_0642 [Prochlorococcus sp. MIT 0602]|nr:hypothetical protein EV06_0642 [Prochlorococcus sp. MIT 0602]KGG18227.1 hypothetical protein EV07_0142 [Prochlorococcus sp. MIT 0603]
MLLFRPLTLFRSITNNKLPQLILVLGGDITREIAGIKITQELHF